MSALLPLLFDKMDCPALAYDDLLLPDTVGPIRVGYFKPWRHQLTRRRGDHKVQKAQDGFKVNLDVQQFRPEEISVKTVDKFVVIEGKHEEREDEHGYISRQFSRRYSIPDDVDPEQMVSSLSSDGVLTVFAPKKGKSLPSNERVIPIIQTQQPAVKAAAAKPAKSQGEGSGEKMEQ